MKKSVEQKRCFFCLANPTQLVLNFDLACCTLCLSKLKAQGVTVEQLEIALANPKLHLQELREYQEIIDRDALNRGVEKILGRK